MLQLEHPCHDKRITKKIVGGHDPVAEYMEKLCSGNGWLCVYSKDQLFYHNILPFSSYFLSCIKHDEEAQSLDQLLNWIHCKSKIT